MNEILPVFCGLLLGAGALRAKSVRGRRWLLVVGSLVGGAVATVVSGEFRIGWEFLLIDIPLVFLTAVGFAVAVRTLRRRLPRQRSAGP